MGECAPFRVWKLEMPLRRAFSVQPPDHSQRRPRTTTDYVRYLCVLVARDQAVGGCSCTVAKWRRWKPLQRLSCHSPSAAVSETEETFHHKGHEHSIEYTMATTGWTAADEKVDAELEAKIAKYTEKIWNTDSDITVVARVCCSGKDKVSLEVSKHQTSSNCDSCDSRRQWPKSMS